MSIPYITYSDGLFEPTYTTVGDLPTTGVQDGTYGLIHNPTTGEANLCAFTSPSWIPEPTQDYKFISTNNTTLLIIGGLINTIHGITPLPAGQMTNLLSVSDPQSGLFYAVNGETDLVYTSPSTAWAAYPILTQFLVDEFGKTYKVNSGAYTLTDENISGSYYPDRDFNTYIGNPPGNPPIDGDVLMVNDNVLRVFLDFIDTHPTEFLGVSPWVEISAPEYMYTADNLKFYYSLTLHVIEQQIQVATAAGDMVLNVEEVNPLDPQEATIAATNNGTIQMGVDLDGVYGWTEIPIIPINNMSSWQPSKFTEKTFQNFIEYFIDPNTAETFDICGKYILTDNGNYSNMKQGEIIMNSNLTVLRYQAGTWILVPNNGNFVFRDKISGNLYIIRSSSIVSTLSTAQSENALVCKYLQGLNTQINPSNILQTSNRLYNQEVPSGSGYLDLTHTFKIPPTALPDGSNTLMLRYDYFVDRWQYDADRLTDGNGGEEPFLAGMSGYGSLSYWTMGTKRTITFVLTKGSVKQTYRNAILLDRTITNVNTDIPVLLYGGSTWTIDGELEDGVFYFDEGKHDLTFNINYELETNVQDVDAKPYFALADITNSLAKIILARGYLPTIDLNLENVQVKGPLASGQVVINYTLNSTDPETPYALLYYPQSSGLPIVVNPPNSMTFSSNQI